MRDTGSGSLQTAQNHDAFSWKLQEILLIVTAMSFDTAAIIDQNGTVLNAAQNCVPLNLSAVSAQDDGQNASR
jgi:hypothetical protein